MMLASVQLFSAVLASVFIAGAQAQFQIPIQDQMGAQDQMEAQVLPGCTKEYTVKAGDFCDKISASQDVSTYQLAHLNPQMQCTKLFAGNKLCLARKGEPDCHPTRVVKPGDTCNAIASATGTTFAILRANNPNINAGCTNIYSGEVLCVAKKKAQVQLGAQVLPECTKEYKVKPGDFCDKISAEQDVSTYQLAHLNPQMQCTKLFAGNKLCLARKGEPDCHPTRVVKPGDTCNAIASATGTTFAVLRANNPNINEDCTNIYAGEVLCVAKKKGLMYCQEEDM